MYSSVNSLICVWRRVQRHTLFDSSYSSNIFGTLHFMKALVYGGIAIDSAHCTKALIAVVLIMVAIMCPFMVRHT